MAIKGPYPFQNLKCKTLLFDLDGTLVDMRPRGLRIRFMMRAFFRYTGAIPFWKIGRAFSDAMHQLQNNKSDRTNYELFIDTLTLYAKVDRSEIEMRTRDLISKDFSRFTTSFVPIPGAYETLLLGRQLGYQVVLATNPVWPLDAVMMRASWGGVQPFDFDFISHSEIMTRAKPDPEYYEQLLTKLKTSSDQCLMIGNDPQKDLPAREAGIRTFLVQRPETRRKWDKISKDPRLDGWGSLFDLQEWMKNNAPNQRAGANR